MHFLPNPKCASSSSSHCPLLLAIATVADWSLPLLPSPPTPIVVLHRSDRTLTSSVPKRHLFLSRLPYSSCHHRRCGQPEHSSPTTVPDLLLSSSVWITPSLPWFPKCASFYLGCLLLLVVVAAVAVIVADRNLPLRPLSLIQHCPPPPGPHPHFPDSRSVPLPLPAALFFWSPLSPSLWLTRAFLFNHCPRPIAVLLRPDCVLTTGHCRVPSSPHASDCALADWCPPFWLSLIIVVVVVVVIAIRSIRPTHLAELFVGPPSHIKPSLDIPN